MGLSSNASVGVFGGGGSVTAASIAAAITSDADAEAVGGALAYRSVPTLASTTGWTLRAGVGGATITGGKVRLTAPLTTPDGGWSGVPLAAFAHGIAGRHPLHSIDAVARLATLTGGDSTDVFVGFGLRVGTSAVDGFVLQARADGGNTFGYAETIGSAGAIGSTAGIGRATLAGGQWWQRVTIDAGTVRFYYGTGSGGAEPTTWTELGSSSSMTGVTTASVAYLECTLGLGGAGSPDAVTAEWDNIRCAIMGLR